MQSSFTFKDFLLLVMVLALIVLGFLNMTQHDRTFKMASETKAAIEQQAATLGQLRRVLEDRSRAGGDSAAVAEAINALSAQIARLQALPAGSIGVGTDSGTAAVAPDPRASWARPGVPIDWQTDVAPFIVDPRDLERFAEGGELIETIEGRPAKITPYMYSDTYGRRIVNDVVCEALGRYNHQTLELQGWLAEAWQFDPEGMWLRVKIRDEACFSDATPVTAADVKFTFDAVMDPQMDTERFRSVLNVIDRVEVISDKVCEFHFESPRFSNKSAALVMAVLPAHVYSRLSPSQWNSATGFLMGSGAYRLETVDLDNQWAPPADVVLVRNENYWGVRQPVDALRFKIIQNYVANLADFENGGSHMMRATPEQFREKSEDESFARDNYMMAWSNMQGGYSFIVWNNSQRGGKPSFFADRRVRLAMTHMIDRDRINRDFYMGLAEIATGPMPPGPASNPEVEPWPYDEEMARRLLAEAGWLDRDGNGILENERNEEFRWEYTFSTGSTTTDKIGAYIVDQCRKMGIVCTIRKIDWSIMDTVLDTRDFDGLTMAWSASAPESDPYQLWHSASILNQGDNFAQWNSPEADRLIDLGRSTLDDAERMKVWHRLHRLIHDEQPYTFLLQLPWIRFIDRDLANVHPYPIGLNKEEWYFPAGPGAPLPN